MARFFFTAGLILIVLVLSSGTSYANHGSVLGSNTTSARVDLTINQGPGLLLPSSPFYALDLLRDNLSLVLASFDQNAKAKLHLRIAGERIVEIRAMLDGKAMDERGLDIALGNIAENIEGANLALKMSKSRGNNVEKLANDLNNTINEQKEALRALRDLAHVPDRLKIEASLLRVREAEIAIEDEMPTDLLVQEEINELKVALVEEKEAASKAAVLAEELEKKASVVLGVEASKSASKEKTRESSGSGSSDKD